MVAVILIVVVIGDKMGMEGVAVEMYLIPGGPVGVMVMVARVLGVAVNRPPHSRVVDGNWGMHLEVEVEMRILMLTLRVMYQIRPGWRRGMCLVEDDITEDL